tara:strand:+ start:961 stop:1341 length:381 start_codon:yes stop_codon:yes gene_type:complete
MIKNKNTFKFICLIFLSLLFAQCKKDYNVESLTGTYINRNYDYTPFVPEIPYVNDTLVLNKDLTFDSAFWGEGTYKIENSLRGSSVKLRYNYEFGKASYTAKIEENGKGLKIILFEKKNHHYEKIK